MHHGTESTLVSNFTDYTANIQLYPKGQTSSVTTAKLKANRHCLDTKHSLTDTHAEARQHETQESVSNSTRASFLPKRKMTLCLE